MHECARNGAAQSKWLLAKPELDNQRFEIARKTASQRANRRGIAPFARVHTGWRTVETYSALP
jgi:hypothetical protein